MPAVTPSPLSYRIRRLVFPPCSLSNLLAAVGRFLGTTSEDLQHHRCFNPGAHGEHGPTDHAAAVQFYLDSYVSLPRRSADIGDFTNPSAVVASWA
jgi:hypothetical protein